MDIHKINIPDNIKIICVDCWDTVLHRTCSPNDVLDSYYEQISNKISVSKKVIEEIWTVSRKILDNRASLVGIEDVHFNDFIVEFFNRIQCAATNFSYSLNDFSNLILETVLTVENTVVVVNDELLEWLEMENRRGIQVVCISDFYMPQSWLINLYRLRKIDHIFDRVYVSSNFGLRKSTGSLYSYVRDNLSDDTAELLFSEMCMIGDNRFSDYLVPKKLGINAFLYNKNIVKKDVLSVERQLLFIYKANIYKNFPFCNYSFTLYIFCEKLLNSLKEKGLNEVFFLSREGKALRLFFEYFLKLQGESITCHYLYVSRQSTFLPSLSAIRCENFHSLRSKVRDFSIRDFLDSLGLQDVCAPYLCDKYDLDKVEKNFLDSVAFETLKADTYFTSIYDQERLKAKDNIIQYFQKQQFCIQTDKPYAIVDIGWRGSIQDAIENILDHKYTIWGYYYGIFGDANISNNGHRKLGLVFSDFPIKSRDYELYSVNCRMLERLFYANHGSCIAYSNQEAILKKFQDKEAELYAFVHPMQIEICHNFNSIHDVLKCTRNYGNDNVGEIAIREIHKLFSINITKKRFTQMKYMNVRMDINFANYQHSSYITTLHKNLRYFIDFLHNKKFRNNNIEIIQKTEFLLYDIKFCWIANFLQILICSIFKFKQKFWNKKTRVLL